METLYKIRNKKTGKFSPGGGRANIHFYESDWRVKGGKVWTNIGALKNHLNQFLGKHGGGIPEDWEVIQYELRIASTHDPADLIDIFKLLKK